MNLLKRALAGDFRASIEATDVPLTSTTLADLLAGDFKVDSGVAVSTKTSLGVTAVWRAVTLISGGVGMLPLESYKLDSDQNRKRTTDQHAVLLDPHPEMTQIEFWALVVMHVLLHGNSYSFKVRRPGDEKVTSLEPLLPERVRVTKLDNTKLFLVRKDDGNEEVFTSKEIFHIPGVSLDGITGLSPISLARQTVGLAIAAEVYGAKLFGDGALMSGVLETDRRLEPEQAKALKDRWNAMTQGITAAHQTAVLDSGARFKAISIPPEDAQFLETRRFSVTEIARLFGVPPHLLMETEKSTSWGTGIEQQNLGYVIHTLGPHLSRVAGRATKELVPRGQFCEHNTSALLRGDTLKRYQAYGLGIKDGWLKRADARRAENLPVDDESLEEYIDPTKTTSPAPAPDASEDDQEPKPQDDTGDDDQE